MISVLDPTSLAGRDLVAGLEERLPGVSIRLFHTLGREEHLVVDLADGPTLVNPLTDLNELSRSRAVVVTTALDDATALRLLAWLRAEPAVVLLDLSQPGIAGEAATTLLDTAPTWTSPGWFHLPDPSLVGPVRMVRALSRFAPQAAVMVVTRPVSIHGEDALHELAAQAAARLSGAKPPHAGALRVPIAFDLAPIDDAELFALERQVAALLPGLDATLHVLDAGIFHGHTAAVSVRCASEPDDEGVRRALRAAPGLELARRNTRLLIGDVSELKAVSCGAVRVRGRTVSAWMVVDGLRTGAAAAALDLLAEITAPS